MCEIQLIKRFGKDIKTRDIDSFNNMLTLGSYTNNDAWGIFNYNTMIRRAGAYHKLSRTKKRNTYIKLNKKGVGNFLVGHNRFTTTGTAKKKHNNHPFNTKDLVMVHNGVITNGDIIENVYKLDYKGETDSIVVVQALQHLLDKGINIIKSIKEVAGQLEGSFSIVILDKRDGKLYYFKNSYTSFYFGFVKEGKDKLLLGSTSEKNFDEVYLQKEFIFEYKNPELLATIKASSGRIYLIDDEGIFEKDTFTESVASYGVKDYDDWSGWGIKSLEQMTLYDISAEVVNILKDFGYTPTYGTDYQLTQLKFYMDGVDITKEHGLYNILVGYGELNLDGDWVMERPYIELFLQDYGNEEDYK